MTGVEEDARGHVTREKQVHSQSRQDQASLIGGEQDLQL